MKSLSVLPLRRLPVLAAAISATLPWICVVSGVRAWFGLFASVFLGYVTAASRGRVFDDRKVLWSDWRTGSACLVLIVDLLAVERPWRVDQVLDGLANGFANLASAVLPVSSARGVLVGPLIVVFGSTWISSKMISNGRQIYWSVSPLLANFGIATGFAARNNGATSLFGALLLVTLLVLFSSMSTSSEIHREIGQEHSRIGLLLRRTIPFALFAIVATCLVVVQTHSPLIHGEPKSLKRQIPDLTLSGENPSALLASLRYANATRPIQLFEVSSDEPRQLSVGADGYTLIPMATMSKFDGMSWSLESLSPVSDGNAIPLVRSTNNWEGLSDAGSAFSRVQILPGAVSTNFSRYLPSPGGVVTGVTGTDVNADPLSGFGVSAKPLSAGSEIQIHSVASRRTPPIVSPNSTPLSPSLCKQLYTYLGLNPIGASCAYQPTKDAPAEIIATVVKNLRQKGGVTPISSSATKNIDTLGQSFRDIQATVLGPQHMGSPEQYATFVALLARSVNLPARIVTGFRLKPQEISGALTSANSYTWAEVSVNGSWVVEDATPSRVGKGSTESSALPQQEKKPVTGGGSDCPPSRLDCDHKILPYAPRGTGNALLGFARDAGLVTTGLVLLLTVWIVCVSILKIRRRRKRRNGSDAERVLGALVELLDSRRELGVRPRLTASTTSEIINTVESETLLPAIGDEGIVRDAINMVYYSPEESTELPVSAVKRWSDRSLRAYRAGASRRAKIRALMYFSRKSG